MGRFIFGIVKRSLMLTIMIVMVSVVLIHEGMAMNHLFQNSSCKNSSINREENLHA